MCPAHADVLMQAKAQILPPAPQGHNIVATHKLDAGVMMATDRTCSTEVQNILACSRKDSTGLTYAAK